MQSVNFEILRQQRPALAELGGFAEHYLHSDPASSLTKLRIYGEQITKAIYWELRLKPPVDATFDRLLAEPDFKQALPRVVLDKLHVLRKEGNKGAHGGQVVADRVPWVLEEAFDLARWFLCHFLGSKPGDIPPFKAIPQPAASKLLASAEAQLGFKLFERIKGRLVATREADILTPEVARLNQDLDSVRRLAASLRDRPHAHLRLGCAPALGLGLLPGVVRDSRAAQPGITFDIHTYHSAELVRGMLTRELDLAVLFDTRLHQAQQASGARRWDMAPLLEEDLFLICARDRGEGPGNPRGRQLPETITVAELVQEPLILPTGPHGLRSTLDTAFARDRVAPHVVLEVDSLAMVMAAVDAGLGSTVQPWAAMGRYPDAAERFQCARLTDAPARRVNLLCSLPDEELSPAALAARVVLTDCVRELVTAGQWFGTTWISGQDTSA